MLPSRRRRNSNSHHNSNGTNKKRQDSSSSVSTTSSTNTTTTTTPARQRQRSTSLLHQQVPSSYRQAQRDAETIEVYEIISYNLITQEMIYVQGGTMLQQTIQYPLIQLTHDSIAVTTILSYLNVQQEKKKIENDDDNEKDNNDLITKWIETYQEHIQLLQLQQEFEQEETTTTTTRRGRKRQKRRSGEGVGDGVASSTGEEREGEGASLSSLSKSSVATTTTTSSSTSEVQQEQQQVSLAITSDTASATPTTSEASSSTTSSSIAEHKQQQARATAATTTATTSSSNNRTVTHSYHSSSSSSSTVRNNHHHHTTTNCIYNKKLSGITSRGKIECITGYFIFPIRTKLELYNKLQYIHKQQRHVINVYQTYENPIDTYRTTHPNWSKFQQEYYIHSSSTSTPTTTTTTTTNSLSNDVVDHDHNDIESTTKTKNKPNDKKKSVVVLDLFAGVGTGIVAIKKMKIAIQKIIHCEKDPIATNTYQYNHDETMKENENEIEEQIQHVYISTFEEIESNLNEFMIQHGPIDIVLVGAPCTDYSAVNATRQGVNGQQGSYLVRSGLMIHQMKNHPIQNNIPLYFMSENVIVKGNDLNVISEAYQITPIPINSDVLSPMSRNRHYFSNIPIDIDYDNIAVHSTVGMCLSHTNDGWKHPADALEQDKIDYHNTACYRKANTMMASKSKLDDSRMLVVKKNYDKKGPAYFGRTYSVLERERLMGYPEGYISKPVHKYFNENFNLVPHIRWEEEPDGTTSVFPKFDPPGREGEYYDEDGYAKRLIGNAYSVPVAAAFMKPLAKLYATRHYPKYDYNYAWPSEIHPWGSGGGDGRVATATSTNEGDPCPVTRAPMDEPDRTSREIKNPQGEDCTTKSFAMGETQTSVEIASRERDSFDVGLASGGLENIHEGDCTSTSFAVGESETSVGVPSKKGDSNIAMSPVEIQNNPIVSVPSKLDDHPSKTTAETSDQGIWVGNPIAGFHDLLEIENKEAEDVARRHEAVPVATIAEDHSHRDEYWDFTPRTQIDTLVRRRRRRRGDY